MLRAWLNLEAAVQSDRWVLGRAFKKTLVYACKGIVKALTISLCLSPLVVYANYVIYLQIKSTRRRGLFLWVFLNL